jgi:signal transduction histidine kinase
MMGDPARTVTPRIADVETLRRASRLQNITAELSQALTPAQVAEVVVEQSLAELDATTAGLWLLAPGGDFADLVHSAGYSVEGKRKFSRIRVRTSMRIPVLDTISTATPVWLTCREEFAEQYPEVAATSAPGSEYAVGSLPLMVHGRCIGALAFTFDTRRAFGDGERGFLTVLARHSAQAVERARLFEAEQLAREEAEAAQERATFLLECSTVLSSSLDFQETLNRVAQLAVPRMADWCVVDIVQDGGEPSQIAVAHSDPQKVELARELRRQYPPQPTRGRGVANVIRTGESELYEDIPDELVAEMAHNEEHLKKTRAVGLKSAMLVPMSARGRTFGAITFVFAESGRRYGRADLETAELLGRRAGVAIDNARLYERAETAARTREQILAVVSHDLRNPLGVIMMNVVTLARLRVEDPTVAARLESNVDSIRRSAERMSRMIGDLLDLASIQAGQLSIERSAFSPAEIVSTAAETFAAMAEERQVQIVTEIDGDCPPIVCDRDRIIQVFSNLLSNAVKVTSAGGRVTVGVSRAAANEVLFSVRDTGHGIAPKDLPRLFDRFYRGQQAPYKGTGLGLTIAKGIVDAHGGRIWVESKAGEGAAFFFRIPINHQPASDDVMT